MNMVKCPQIGVETSNFNNIEASINSQGGGKVFSMFSFSSPIDDIGSQITLSFVNVKNCSGRIFEITDISSLFLKLTLTNLNFTGNTVKSGKLFIN